MSNDSFWSYNTPAFSRRYSLLFEAQKEENDEDEGFPSSWSFLFFLNSFFVLSSHFRPKNPDIYPGF